MLKVFNTLQKKGFLSLYPLSLSLSVSLFLLTSVSLSLPLFCRDLLTIDSNLRQENTELKHRIRQYESRLNSTAATTASEGISNQKLRKQVETLRRELSNLSEAYERLKLNSTREIAKWRSQIIQPAGHDDYKMKYISLQHILDSERIDHRREIQKLLKELKENKGYNSKSRRSPSPAAPTRTSSRKLATQSMASNRLSSGLSTMETVKKPSTRNSSLTNHSLRKSQRMSPSPEPQRNGRDHRRRQDSTHSAHQSHTYASLSRSRSPSSSLGGHFDPTAYARERSRKVESTHRDRAWGSGRSARYGESGYSSANSQVIRIHE
jgi:hypothetical protein